MMISGTAWHTVEENKIGEVSIYYGYLHYPKYLKGHALIENGSIRIVPRPDAKGLIPTIRNGSIFLIDKKFNV